MVTPDCGFILLNTRCRIWHPYVDIAPVLEVYGCGSPIRVGSVHSWNVFHVTSVVIVSLIISHNTFLSKTLNPPVLCIEFSLYKILSLCIITQSI